MVAIPPDENSTVDFIYKSYEQEQENERNDVTKIRGHLGASLIGATCDRKLWYSFRWATWSRHIGRILRLFETGQREEARLTANLRRVGVVVEEVDPATGRQWEVRDSTGHFGGSLDGIARSGIVEAPKTEHVLEYKTHNEKSFKDLCKNKVQISKPQHYAQMQVYMHFKKIKRAFYLAVNKNTDELYQERVYYDFEYAAKLVARAQSIINNPNPPERITAANTPTWHECKMCDHAGVCYGDAAPERHCRSCVFSTPIENGEWHCNKHNQTLSLATQKAGCNFHRYLPRLLVKADQIDAGDNFAWIEYKLPDGTIWRDEG
jgi:CRISPR/Cas system-associated exonuclease Cas4 (RecB family)